ncbi:MAG: DUF1553 domain-containing protein, partial [Acidobacteria bacterium]|nr:DUF1553 domain-containing protein [Acidobacteriota bacterium]
NGAGNLSTSSIPPRVNGRNAFHNFIKASVASDKPISDFVWELIGFSGNNYSEETGMVNFLLRGTAAMGPRQDTLDMQMVKSVTAFLGMSQYDCIACHNGRGHLDQFSLSGKSAVRTEAWRMAAFFARTQLQRPNQRDGSGSLQYKDPLYDSTLVVDTPTGFYVANTLGGNRPDRCANGLPRNIETNRCAASENVSPEYRDGRKPEPGESWRQAFAGFITTDPMFARNFANRLWKAMFNLGLVEPMDQMDPARLDPSDPPPAPWTLQASHPELLEKLAQAFAGNGYSMRAFLRLLAQSSAYQLSSRYDGAWRIEYVPLFARHYPRRLDAEEIHDAIVKATDRPPRYTYPLADGVTMPRGSRLPQSEPFVWAMQSPDTTIANTNFISAFSRGNRDTEPRNQAGSILQQLNLMNDRFVTDRLKVNPSPVLREMAGIEDNAAVTEEMFLTFLSRMPSDRERQVALEYLSRAANRNTGLEDLAWALVNKVDFLFSY